MPCKGVIAKDETMPPIDYCEGSLNFGTGLFFNIFYSFLAAAPLRRPDAYPEEPIRPKVSPVIISSF